MRAAILAVATCLCLCPLLAAEEEPAFKVYCQVYRIDADEALEPVLFDQIWSGSEEYWEEIKDSIVLFERAKFKFGDDVLMLHEPRIFWNDTLLSFEVDEAPAPIRHNIIRLIYSTEVELDYGKTGSVFIAAKQPFQYFERLDNGLFELKEIELPAGLDLRIKARAADDGFISLPNVGIRLRTVTEREPVPGVSLPVGRPVLQTEYYKLNLMVRHRNTYWIQVKPRNGEGSLLIRIYAQYL